ncbi:MAG: ribosome silencing factor [Gammaproteobacteria bacterium]|nr:ribosome silencing factor [Gammaproteobacteria bacterium]
MHEQSKVLADLAVAALEDLKATDITVLDVTDMSSMTDVMIVASARSSRQVRSLVNHLVTEAKAKGYKPLGVEGEKEGEWGLVDLGDVVVHVMQPEVRDFYQLEKLWQIKDEDLAGQK